MQGALKDYNRAIQLDPGYSAAYGNRGNVKSDQGDYHGCVEDQKDGNPP